MSYYPIFLDLAGRRCVVIGGGAVAERKVKGLLRGGAAITVISPRQTEVLKAWAGENKINAISREYQVGDLKGYELAFAATEDRKVNAAVSHEGKTTGVWVNAADDPDHCDFILPSVLRRGELTVAVATGGASPALSRLVREELETYFGADYAVLVEVAAEARKELKGNFPSAAPDRWQRALDENLRSLVRNGKREEAKVYLLAKLGEETCR
jgi:siroheme synthase-like protein